MSIGKVKIPVANTSNNLSKNIKLPNHVAIIMDGNGRWAKKHGFDNIKGHEKGADALEDVIRISMEKEIKYLTVYAFSSENWNRPKPIVNGLMNLISYYVDEKSEEMNEKGICVKIIGNINSFSQRLKKKLISLEEKTKNNNGLMLQIALSYGGREEILTSSKKLLKECIEKNIDPDTLTENDISKNLYCPHIPDPDLVIRTSGEIRISNFLLWQVAYSEFVFMDCLWPDFNEEYFDEALLKYSKRKRNYGK